MIVIHLDISQKTISQSLFGVGQERVQEGVHWTHSFFRDLLQQFSDEVLGLQGKVRGVGGISLLDLPEGFLPAEMIKGRSARKQLKSEYSHAPHVNALPVLLSLHNFRRDVVHGSAVSHPAFIADSSPPEISQLALLLTKDRFTSHIMIFSGLISRWATPLKWRVSTALHKLKIRWTVSSYSNFPFCFSSE